MKFKNFYEEIRSEFMASEQEYCAYCCSVREGTGCCGENHWIEFKDLENDEQDAIINEEFNKAYGEKQ